MSEELGPESVDLLMAEHQQAIDMYRHSEELGERRVNFFLTLMTAVLAALAIGDDPLVEDGHVDGVFWALLIGLLLFGLVTLARIAHRNLRSTQQLRALNRIRTYFVEREPELAERLEFFDPDGPWRGKPWHHVFHSKGGLADTVSLVNSFVVAGIAALAVATRTSDWYMIAPAGVAAGVVGWLVQYAYVRAVYEKERR